MLVCSQFSIVRELGNADGSGVHRAALAPPGSWTPFALEIHKCGIDEGQQPIADCGRGTLLLYGRGEIEPAVQYVREFVFHPPAAACGMHEAKDRRPPSE